MTDAARALQRFYGGFGLPAYAKDNVPDGAAMPYITYERVQPAPMESALARAWIWYRGHDDADLAGKCEQVAGALSDGGTFVEGLYLFMDRRTPFAQAQGDARSDVRCACLTVRVMVV